MTLSDAMSLWHQLKSAYPDALALVKRGNEYTAFYDDARQLAELCGIPLATWQGADVALVPVGALPSYRAVLIGHGVTVTTGDQLELPGVDRAVKPAQLLMF